MATVIGVIRVSTVGQIEGESLGLQRERIQGWCSFQGLTLGAIYEDAGVSGANMDRPGLSKALTQVIALGSEGVFVVTKLDRLGRDALGVQEVLAVLAEAGVRVVALNDGVDSGSGMGAAILRLLTGILANFAELEKDTIRSRLLDGRKRADRDGRVYSSEPRLGRKVAEDGRTLLESPEEQAAITRAKELREQGLSLREIGAALLQEGHHPRRASTWSPSVLRRIVMGQREPRTRKNARSQRLEDFIQRHTQAA